jgi:hypothetical protein
MTDTKAAPKTADYGRIGFASMLLFFPVFIISVMTVFWRQVLLDNGIWHDPIGTATYFAIIYGPWAAFATAEAIFKIAKVAENGEKYPGMITTNYSIGMVACGISAILFSFTAIGVFWLSHIPTADDVKFYTMLAVIGASGYALLFAAMRLTEIVTQPEEVPVGVAEETPA